MNDYMNKPPYVSAHGRLYRATVEVEFYVPEGVPATEEQLEEWLHWEMQLGGSMPDSNPLSSVCLETASAYVRDLEDAKCRDFTEWGETVNGRASGRRRRIPDGAAYTPPAPVVPA